MKNYAGSRLSPWLGHLMVSRSETARPLLTPGEVMQLPPTDEIVMVSGVHPIRAQKARYYEDRRFQERIVPPPAPTRRKEARPDDWTSRPLPPRPSIPVMPAGEEIDDEDPNHADRRRQPEFGRGTVEKHAPIESEFPLGEIDESDEDAPRIGRMNDLMRGFAQQAALDPGDDLGM